MHIQASSSPSSADLCAPSRAVGPTLARRLALVASLSTTARALSTAAGAMTRLQMILSPAKTMNFAPSAVADAAGASEAVGLDRVNELAAILRKKSKGELKALLDVSDAIAAENHKRFAEWDSAETLQACVAYDGMAHAGVPWR